jgi:hypothetical protein
LQKSASGRIMQSDGWFQLCRLVNPASLERHSD